MGLTVREMLNSNLFKDFKILAGKNGLDNQIQGIASLDAPDGFYWTKGKEFVINSGYVFHVNPGLFEEFVENDSFKKIACFGIKDRYIKKIPKKIIYKFDEKKIPLILIPSKVPWMEIMNNINVIVMNRDIRLFNIGSVHPNISDLSYHAKKIKRILTQLEKRMGFPAMLYDLSNETAYYSSNSFSKISDNFETKDFWEHKFPVSKEVICDNLQFIRYRYTDERYEIPYSWLSIPITVMGKIKAYFVVLEATSLIDYFDQFAIRISFLLLQSIFEQFLFFESVGDTEFEKLVNDILNNTLSNKEMITKNAIDIDIDVYKKHYIILMQQMNPNFTLSSHKFTINKTVRNMFLYENIRMCFVDENSILILLQKSEDTYSNDNIGSTKSRLESLNLKLKDSFNSSDCKFGLNDNPEYIYNLKRSYKKCVQAINIGNLIYNEKLIISYKELGPLGWLQIEEDEMKEMIDEMNFVINSNGNNELLETLKSYLDCKMNYSLTAKNMYVHINTVRKRIDKVKNLLELRLDDPVSRLKLELFLILYKK